MKNLKMIVLLIAITCVLAACRKDRFGEGPVSTQSRSIQAFKGINLRMNGTVTYKTDSVFRLTITAKETVHAALETTVSNGQLIIRYRNGKTYDADPEIQIAVAAPEITQITNENSGSIIFLSPLFAGSVLLRNEGSGYIRLQNIQCGLLEARNLGSGLISATGGGVTTAKLQTEGSGRIQLLSLPARNAEAQVTGSGTISIMATHRLDAVITGSGYIYFDGNPFITSVIHGSGHVIKL